MNRRSVLQAVAGSIVAATAGCIESEQSGVEGSPASRSESSKSQTGEVLIDETLYGEARYPVEMSQGASLTIHVDVEKGGPVIVIVLNTDSDDSVLREVVETETTLKTSIEEGGPHYIIFGRVDEAHVKAVLTE